MVQMNAIQTKYNGVTYRSRVEARWAVFFEHMGWPAVYEQEGFDFGSERYLPDFWLPEFGIYAEIKAGTPSEEEVSKCRLLAERSGKTVWLLAGSPGDGAYKIFVYDNDAEDNWLDQESVKRQFLSCRRCPRPVIYHSYSNVYVPDHGQNMDGWGWREIGEKCTRGDCGDRSPIVDDKLRQAMSAARDERFGVHDHKRR